MAIPTQIVDAIHKAKAEGLTDAETASLAETYASSGIRLTFQVQGTADVASTGGPASLSTLIAPLMLVDLGLAVPKLAVPGRPAGGLDVLAQIPGYAIDLDPSQISQTIEACGYAHFISSDRYAPMDAETFAYRQSIGAQQVPSLVIASLLAKKLAAGVSRVGLDVRVARHGNFGATFEQARANSARFVAVARLLGLEAVCVLSDVTHPPQPFIGRTEALWALHSVFSGEGETWLLDHISQIARMIAALCGETAATDPKVLVRRFEANLAAQGASLNAFEKIAQAAEGDHLRTVDAPMSGCIVYDLEAIRDSIVATQHKLSSNVRFPDPAGVRLLKRPGARVEAGESVMSVRASSSDWSELEGRIKSAFSVHTEVSPPQPEEIIYGD